jgi:DNA-binding response OmpR family regulator
MQYLLIVEDDIELAEGIKMAFEDEGLHFTLCKTLQEARTILSEKQFDLIILDINLPDGSGLTLCKEIRSSSKVPIMLLTAKDMELDIVAGLGCGGDDYITKPFSLMVLRARIKALLRRNEYHGGQQREYVKGSFRFRFDTMEFFKDNQMIDLSKTEQRILHLLVFHEGQVITRNRLMEWVWPEGTEYVEDNALSVGIRRLWDKLEEVSSKPKYIKTVYGKGYVWENIIC